jgi:hypothetical protein
MLRLFGLLFGLPVLLIGTICIGVALSGVIGNALNKDPNSHAIGAFPVFALYGLPFVWLGYRLVFTRPVKPSMPKFKRPKRSS